MCVCIAQFAYAAPTNEQIERAKAETIEDICSDGGAWLACYSQPPESCHALVEIFVTRCFNRVFGGDAMFDALSDDVDADVERLTDCFRKAFLARYQKEHKETPECSNIPEHLQ